jgi:hypothetical protein
MLESTRPAASKLGDITRNYTRTSDGRGGQGSRNGTSYFNNVMQLANTKWSHVLPALDKHGKGVIKDTNV